MLRKRTFIAIKSNWIGQENTVNEIFFIIISTDFYAYICEVIFYVITTLFCPTFFRFTLNNVFLSLQPFSSYKPLLSKRQQIKCANLQFELISIQKFSQ